MGKKLKTAAKVAGGIAATALVAGALYSLRGNANAFAELNTSMSNRVRLHDYWSNSDVRQRQAYNRLAVMGAHLVANLQRPTISPPVVDTRYQTMEQAFGFDWL